MGEESSAWVRAIIPVFAFFWYYFLILASRHRGLPCLGWLGLDLSGLAGDQQSGKGLDGKQNETDRNRRNKRNTRNKSTIWIEGGGWAYDTTGWEMEPPDTNCTQKEGERGVGLDRMWAPPMCHPACLNMSQSLGKQGSWTKTGHKSRTQRQNRARLGTWCWKACSEYRRQTMRKQSRPGRCARPLSIAGRVAELPDVAALAHVCLSA